MDGSTVSMINLPDELILIICSEMKTIDVLYSFIGVNKRFNRLARDPIFTQSIELVKRNDAGKTRPLSDLVLDRFCRQVLPEIHILVESLSVASGSAVRCLSVGHYPKLTTLILLDVDEKFAARHFTEKAPFIHLFQTQISSLAVILVDPGRFGLMSQITTNILAPIFSLFTSLIDLDCSRRGSNWFRTRFPPADSSSKLFFSSSIVRLRVDVETLDDCLYLLDGRLPHLQRLIIEIELINQSDLVADTKVLANLKSLSFISWRNVKVYDSHLHPLLCQMMRLEELTLRLSVTDRSAFIESTHLSGQILPYFPHLRTFSYDIYTDVSSVSDVLEQPIKEIQHLSYNGKCHPLVCYMHSLESGGACSHIFSLPFVFDTMEFISSYFPGGYSFTNVRRLLLFDIDQPMEHDFFVRIAASFPRLTSLSVTSYRAQEKNQIRRCSENGSLAPLVQFDHLNKLEITDGHLDYAEQFLLDTNTLLPRLKELTIDYERLFIATEHFTRHATRRNCMNIERLQLMQPIVYSEAMYLYFPRCR